MSLPPLSDLTLPQGSTATLRAVLSAALRRALADLGRLRGGGLEALRPVLRAALSRAPGAVFGVLRRPTVGAAIRVLRERPDETLAAQLALTLALELSHAGVALPPLEFASTPARALCLGGRFALEAGGPAKLTDGVLTCGGQATPVARPRLRPYHELSAGLALATLDDNPLADHEAHPDKSGNAVDLGGRSAAEWCAALDDAIARVARYLPLVHEELALAVQQIVPVGFDARAHLSATYREAIGTLYVSLHPDPMTMTEALIHELSHTKLNAALESGPLLDNPFAPLFESPLRPDPRPLHGVLLAVHAFLPVAELYRRMRAAEDPLCVRPEFERRFAEIEDKNRDGMRTLLDHARPTPLGAPLLDEMGRLSGLRP